MVQTTTAWRLQQLIMMMVIVATASHAPLLHSAWYGKLACFVPLQLDSQPPNP